MHTYTHTHTHTHTHTQTGRAGPSLLDARRGPRIRHARHPTARTARVYSPFASRGSAPCRKCPADGGRAGGGGDSHGGVGGGRSAQVWERGLRAHCHCWCALCVWWCGGVVGRDWSGGMGSFWCWCFQTHACTQACTYACMYVCMHVRATIVSIMQ